ncbi:MAG: acylphosphatase [Actinobacteria bacterium]|nr:acylphosphatase [Actinomycetota bacterium]MCW3043885.1 acylphosphatase [Actinomycetota bacterium]
MGHEKARAHVFVSGQVQGVFFRAETSRLARSKGVAGWVRNLPDGQVEAIFEAPKWVVESMLEWMRTGPRGAAVSSVDVSWEDPGTEQGFSVR